MPNWKHLAGLGAEVGVASNLMDAFNYNRDFDWTDIVVPGKGLYNAVASGDGRRIGSQMLAAGLPLSGAALGHALKGEAGSLIGGLAGSASALPIETFTLNQAKQNITADDMAAAAGNNTKLMAMLGVGALGLGGLAVLKYLKKQNMPDEHGTIQYKLKGKKGDPDSEATVTIPINHPEFSPRMVEGLNAGIKRGLGKTVRYNSYKRDPITGRTIPYETWMELYGKKDKSMQYNDAMGKFASLMAKSAGRPVYRTRDKRTMDAVDKVYNSPGGKRMNAEEFRKAVERQYAKDSRDGSRAKAEKRAAAKNMHPWPLMAALSGMDKHAAADTDPETALVNTPTGHRLHEEEDKTNKKDSHEARYGFTLGGGLAGGAIGALAGVAGGADPVKDGIAAGLSGSATGSLLGMTVDTYRNLATAAEREGRPVRNAAAIGLGGLGALGGGIAGWRASANHGLFGGTTRSNILSAILGGTLGAAVGTRTGLGIDSFRSAVDLNKHASADPGDVTMQLTDRTVRPAETVENGAWHSLMPGQRPHGTAGSALKGGLATQEVKTASSRAWDEGAGSILTSLGTGVAGGLAGKALAERNMVDPWLGAGAGAVAGAVLPSLLGRALGSAVGARTVEDQAAHDSGAAVAEYIVPGYGSYQHARRGRTEEAARQTMKSYLATGAMPGGQADIPSNLDIDDMEGGEDALDKWASAAPAPAPAPAPAAPAPAQAPQQQAPAPQQKKGPATAPVRNGGAAPSVPGAVASATPYNAGSLTPGQNAANVIAQAGNLRRMS